MSKKFFIFSFLLVFATNHLFAENPPKPSDTIIPFDNIKNTSPYKFNNSLEDNSSLVGDDTMPDKNISRGLHYRVNTGKSSGHWETSEDGTRVYVDNNGNVISKKISDYNETEKINKDYYKNYTEYVKDKNKTIEKDRSIKKQMYENTYEKNSFNEIKDRTISGINIIGAGKNVQESFTRKQLKSKESSLLKEIEQNATTLYSQTISSDMTAYTDTQIKQKNLGVLSKAQNAIEDIREYMKSKTKLTSLIKCKIARELVPTYICPIEGKNGLMFPSYSANTDLRRVNITLAKEECDKYCHTDPGTLTCTSEKILDSNKTDISLSNPIELFPDYNLEKSTKEFKLNPIMPLDYIAFNLKVVKPNTDKFKDMNETEWQEYIERNNLKVKYSVLSIPKNPNILPYTIVNKSIIRILSPEMKIKVPVNLNVSKIRIIFYKPYIEENPVYKYQNEEPYLEALKKDGVKIEITKMEGFYTSNSFYYCEAKQIVDYPSECQGPIKSLEATGQLKYVCGDSKSKIGPEPNWGAFYSKKSCEEACILYKECYPSYVHYGFSSSSDITNDPNFLYRTKIMCVDDPDNTSCTDSLCESLFADTNIKPVNEMVVYNDDKFVYTIRNGARTKVERPKIDLGAEMSGNPDYDLIFSNEEKDSAFLYMLNNIRYNKSKIRIGQNTNIETAYILDKFGDSVKKMSVLLKPKAFDYDDNIREYIYIIAKVLHSYKPVAGVWWVDGQKITAKSDHVRWTDLTYLLLDGANKKWKTFRREKFVQTLIDKNETVLSDTGEPVVQHIVYWVHSPAYYDPKFEKYSENMKKWITFSSSETALESYQDYFVSNKNYFKYTVGDLNYEEDLFNTPGTLIVNQIPIEHETNFKRMYLPEEKKKENASYPQNIVLYIIYSPTRLNYDQIMRKIEGENYNKYNEKMKPADNVYAFYDKVNSFKYSRDTIRGDELLNNGIHLFVKGKPSSTTIGGEWEPSISEKGKKEFKFLFLYEDTDESFLNPVKAAKEDLQNN